MRRLGLTCPRTGQGTDQFRWTRGRSMGLGWPGPRDTHSAPAHCHPQNHALSSSTSGLDLKPLLVASFQRFDLVYSCFVRFWLILCESLVCHIIVGPSF